MKNIFLVLMIVASFSTRAQEFDKNLASAKSSYSSGDLENARFAMEQMLRDLDVVIGKEILKLLPTSMGALKYTAAEDNVSGSSAGMATGLFVHRQYGTEVKMAKLEIINNSPLITSINAILSIPFMGNSSDGSQKVVKVQGYKSILNKNVNEQTGKTGYTLQVPMNNTLFTLEMNDTDESEIQQLAATLPLSKIVQIAQ
jgi:hypothetical protein